MKEGCNAYKTIIDDQWSESEESYNAQKKGGDVGRVGGWGVGG